MNVLTKCSGIRDGDRLLTFDEVVDILNSQNETIAFLEAERVERDKELLDLHHRLRKQYEKRAQTVNVLQEYYDVLTRERFFDVEMKYGKFLIQSFQKVGIDIIISIAKELGIELNN